MKIDNYINKPFRIEGRQYYIEKIVDRMPGINGYIINDQYDQHVANVNEIDDDGFRWFSYLLNSGIIEGKIRFSDLDRK